MLNCARRRGPWGAVALVLVALAFVACGSSDAELVVPEATRDVSAEASRPVYLALGDSLAVGIGARDWATGGYVGLLHASLNADRGPADAFVLRNVARSGADTRSAIEDGQLAEAIAIIEERRATETLADDVQVVTIGLGGNDGFALVAVCGGVIDDACFAAAERQIGDVGKNLSFILGRLQAAAGPDARVVVMTYYNPLIHERCPLNEFELIGDVVLEGQPDLGVSRGVNDEIRDAAAAAGVPVAEVDELPVSELVGDCLHANDEGHARIALAFEAVLGS
jgi:lysophospholipase L1-like esterase